MLEPKFLFLLHILYTVHFLSLTMTIPVRKTIFHKPTSPTLKSYGSECIYDRLDFLSMTFLTEVSWH